MASKITLMNANLFALAAQYYNDATKWILIAQANGLTDPFVFGQVNLIIPANAAPTGGLAAQ